jgi:1-acyl-sn-glycerol-3-phosphate acyltransferase
MIALLRSLVFTIVFYLGSVPIVGTAALLAPVSSGGVRVMAQIWARWFLWTTTLLLGVRLRIEGTAPQHAVIIAAKHQSAYETIIALYLFDNPAVVMKAELLAIPVWGFVAKSQGAIPIDREASTGAMRTMMRAAQAAKAADRPVVIFVEGTRVPWGEAPAIKPGFVGLYRTLKLPVVPVALDSGRVWRKGFVKESGTITVRFGEAVPPGLERSDIEARVHAAINALNIR